MTVFWAAWGEWFLPSSVEPMSVLGLKSCHGRVLQNRVEGENSALMLGSDRSRGYCLEMICADFLAGANLDNGDPETLLFSMTRFFRFLPPEQQQAFLESLTANAS
jgi:hypothetical protein